jgi:hypothetical protein
LCSHTPSHTRSAPPIARALEHRFHERLRDAAPVPRRVDVDALDLGGPRGDDAGGPMVERSCA